MRIGREGREGREGLSGKAHFMQFIEMFTRDGFPFPTKYPTVLSFHCSDITEQYYWVHKGVGEGRNKKGNN